ncbi:redoxin domain-containing protein [Acidipila sp. EB88]|uniref:redoxin domain-containing protein n=1 Tax=Acidipila sp. EB88 TaxID=2305226 RepID=UPI000F5F22A9|nr:redoxin domain-containing protein [Acidipila sp. EB88]RRA49424.1 thioredoxin family protein [Acidipila sp. EB88]
MKRAAMVLLGTALLAVSSAHAVKVGTVAPNFTAKDSQGQTETLAQYRGKFVVLEWTNRDCPYTKKQYDSGNMQRLQKQWGAKGVVWLSVLSSAPGQEGYSSAADENAYLHKVGAAPRAALLDPAGALGHMYEAKTTPHMYVIDPKGVLVYEGAIDSDRSTDPAGLKGSENYVSEALTEAMDGQPIAKTYTQPYGCAVKYGQ